MARKRAGRPPLLQPKFQQSDRPSPAVAVEDVEGLPKDIFTEPLDITKSKENFFSTPLLKYSI